MYVFFLNFYMFINPIEVNLHYLYQLVNSWWPWVDFFNEIFLIQILLVIIFIYVNVYSSPFYTLLYVFILFFLVGIALSIFQLELFTAFLWLIECSVVFIFLLLLFYLNVKNVFLQTKELLYYHIYICVYLIYIILTNQNTGLFFAGLVIYHILDNSYECVFNFLQNDLFVFFISYYVLNNIEFVVIGLLLLVGSMVCVNLYLVNKNVRIQNYNSFFNVFSFFLDMCGFVFLRKQNLVKQGNSKASLKVFLKK